jgi:hypothetical protein
MLKHLETTYSTITPLEIEQNRATLTSAWKPDDDIEGLWVRICDAQLLAKCANEEILDPAAIRLTVQALDALGVFDFALDNWRLKDNATKTMLSFKEQINKEDSERNCKLSAKTGGYHGANGADGNHPRDTPPPNPTPTSGSVVLPNGVKMYYCWSPGLGINKQHTSPTCTFKKDGHIDTATADNTQGGCNLIMGPPAVSAATFPRLAHRPDGEGSRWRYQQLVKQCSMN